MIRKEKWEDTLLAKTDSERRNDIYKFYHKMQAKVLTQENYQQIIEANKEGTWIEHPLIA